MAIRDIVRRGYAATIGKVVTRGYVPGVPPTPHITDTVTGSYPVYAVVGSLPVYAVTGSMNDD